VTIKLIFPVIFAFDTNIKNKPTIISKVAIGLTQF
jgi:hypothetical protein